MASSCEVIASTNGSSHHDDNTTNKCEHGERKVIVKSQTRADMTAFWEEHSHEASEQEMMLDSHAEELGKQEVPEILSSIPEVVGFDVLELGAGIGRFTGHLAVESGAASVTAVDFMESFVKKNREINGHLNNVKFLQADVTQLILEPLSYDLVFSNWLLMYLSEVEVFSLFQRVIQWLRPDGYFFFRESCYHPSGDASRKHNPTKYRSPGVYDDLYKSVSFQDVDGFVYGFDLLVTRPVQTYIKLKANHNQICWLLRKTRRLASSNDNGSSSSNGLTTNGLNQH